MARKDKYTEDLMLDAVIKYSEVTPGKIKLTELAKWANENIPGLEGIQDYHFRNKRKVINPRSGKIERRNTDAYDRVQQINNSRNLISGISTNVLMHSPDPDDFTRLPRPEQRKQILDMRQRVKQMADDHMDLTLRNNILADDNAHLKKENDELSTKLEEIKKNQDKLNKRISMLIKYIDEQGCRDALKEIGIDDDGIDLTVYVDRLNTKITDAFSVKRTITSFHQANIENLMGGINFEED